jgi:hypothetical protein
MKMLIKLDFHIAINLDDYVDDYYLNVEEVDTDLVVNRFVVVVVIEQYHEPFDQNHFVVESDLEDYDIVVLEMFVE